MSTDPIPIPPEELPPGEVATEEEAMMMKEWNQDSPGAMEEFNDYLLRVGAPCSICGQAFSKMNPPSITCHMFEHYNTDCIYTAVCYVHPFVDRHPYVAPVLSEEEAEAEAAKKEPLEPWQDPPPSKKEQLNRVKYSWFYQNTPETGIRQISTRQFQAVCERPGMDMEEEGPEPGAPPTDNPGA